MIATAVVHMLRYPDPIVNHPVFLCGVKGLTQNAILAALEAETASVGGGKGFDVRYVDIQAMRKDAFEALERGGGGGGDGGENGDGENKKQLGMAMRGLTLNAQFNELDSGANFWDLVENDIVGVEAVDVRTAVREFLKSKGLVLRFGNCALCR